MPAYVYRDQLLEQLAPLLELLDITPRQLVALRLNVHGIEVDYVPTPTRPNDFQFAYYQIADRHEEHELSSDVYPSVAGSSPDDGPEEHPMDCDCKHCRDDRLTLAQQGTEPGGSR